MVIVEDYVQDGDFNFNQNSIVAVWGKSTSSIYTVNMVALFWKQTCFLTPSI